MLFQLSIQNFALIDSLRLEFTSGLNVLTGETGAGKSILMDALRIVLGERFENSQILDKDRSCVIEAVFLASALAENREAFHEFLQDGDEFLVFKREMTGEGRSRNFINQQFVNLSVLRDFGQRLIDFHGQFDQQNLFLPEYHRGFLDRLAGLGRGPQESLAAGYRDLYGRYDAMLAEQRRLRESCEGKERRLDLLRYQIDEIEKVDPAPEEEDTLKTERIRLSHARKLDELTASILNTLDQEDVSASSRLSEAFRHFISWSKIDESASEPLKRLETVQTELEELLAWIRDYREKLSFEDSRLDEIQERLDQMEMLRKKYGGSMSAVLEFLGQARGEYEMLLNSEAAEKDFEKELAALRPELEKKAAEISRLRKRAAGDLKKQIEGELKDLAFTQAVFECSFSEGPLGPHGRDQVEFLFSPNPGFGLKPLAKIASGGEASRILLALKRALAKVDAVPTLIFDEIDANIGGRLGEIVGRKLREIGEERQVLLITHLPQIASFAQRHVKVTKQVVKGLTRVRYEVLEGDAKVKELAQMMSGVRETAISRTHAQEMLKSASR